MNFTLLQKGSFSNKCCSVEVSIHQRILLKKMYYGVHINIEHFYH